MYAEAELLTFEAVFPKYLAFIREFDSQLSVSAVQDLQLRAYQLPLERDNDPFGWRSMLHAARTSSPSTKVKGSK